MNSIISKTTRGKISGKDIIYTAGLIDGEGSIIITKARRNHPKYKCPHYILMVCCTNTDMEIIEWMYNTYGASKPIRKRVRNHPYWKTAYDWNVSANKALKFLEMIYPYLRIKEKQAELAIEFQKGKMAGRKFVNSAVSNGHTLSKETLERRENYYQRMHILNTGGEYRRGKISPAETK